MRSQLSKVQQTRGTDPCLNQGQGVCTTTQKEFEETVKNLTGFERTQAQQVAEAATAKSTAGCRDFVGSCTAPDGDDAGATATAGDMPCFRYTCQRLLLAKVGDLADQAGWQYIYFELH